MTKQTNLAKAQFLSLPLCVWRRGLGKSESSSKQVAAYQKQQVEWQDNNVRMRTTWLQHHGIKDWRVFVKTVVQFATKCSKSRVLSIRKLTQFESLLVFIVSLSSYARKVFELWTCRTLGQTASAQPFFGSFTPSSPIISTFKRPRNAKDILLTRPGSQRVAAVHWVQLDLLRRSWV